VTIRRRRITIPYGMGTRRTRSSSGTVNVFSAGNHFDSTQVTESFGHRWPPKGGFGDIGGRFSTTKVTIDTGSLAGIHIPWTASGPTYYEYSGQITPPFLSPPTTAGSSDSVNESYGATAVARCAPTNSVADVSTFMGELVKDGLPSLPGISMMESKVSAAINAGDEYLNAVFGWMPLLNDVTKFGESVRKADAVLAQYERDAGKVVRRRYQFPDETSTSTIQIQTNQRAAICGGLASFPASPGDSGVPLYRTDERTTKRWFSGAFTYYLPSGYDSRNALASYASRADKLFGTSITPSTLWELAPWSWAVDWFSNAGDVIDNISANISNGLILRYGYVMENTIVKRTFTMPRAALLGVPNAGVPPFTFIAESKKRVRANPYGFGLTWDGLSPYQVSVLSALGITRS
jgi:hypothetical protein